MCGRAGSRRGRGCSVRGRGAPGWGRGGGEETQPGTRIRTAVRRELQGRLPVSPYLPVWGGIQLLGMLPLLQVEAALPSPRHLCSVCKQSGLWKCVLLHWKTFKGKKPSPVVFSTIYFFKTNIFKHKYVLFVHFGKNPRMLKKKKNRGIVSSWNLFTLMFIL
uniref:Uncharacterized protein n=1 Tax=Phasianus colchicus TaxID=9054 RepID=A0A669PKW5_PHACC